jgi:hypothetical protein
MTPATQPAPVTHPILLLTAIFVLVFNPQVLTAGDGPERICQALTIAASAELLDGSPGDLQRSSRAMPVSPEDLKSKTYPVPPASCTIQSKTDFSKSIAFNVTTYSGSQQARRAMNEMKAGFAGVSTVEPVAGIGDAAFWAGDPRFKRLVAVKGAVLVDVMRPGERERQERIIRLVLEQP